MNIVDTPQSIVGPAPISVCALRLIRGERGAISSDKIASSDAGEGEQRPTATHPPHIPGGFDFHLGVYAVF